MTTLTKYKYEIWSNNYRFKVARSFAPQPDRVARNAEHGSECSEPAEQVCYEGISVVQVLDFRPLDQTEHEYSLEIRQETTHFLPTLPLEFMSGLKLGNLALLTKQIVGVEITQQNFHQEIG